MEQFTDTSSCSTADRTVPIRRITLSSTPLQRTRRHTSDNKFQRLDISSEPDVLVLYVKPDQLFVEQQLLPVLSNEGITFDILHDEHAETDRTVFQRITQMVDNRSSKVIFVISKSFSANPTFSILPSIAIHYISNEKVLCLLVDEYVKFEDNLRSLSSTRCLLCSEANWKTYLLRHIRIRTPKFTHLIDPRSVTQCIQQHGFDIRHMTFDIHGLCVGLNQSTLRIDVEEFRKHMTEHTYKGTHKVCAECSLLRTPGTTVSLIFRNNIKQHTDVEAFDRIVTHLCSNVFDILPLRRANIPLTLGCTLMGRPLQDRTYIRKLWLKIMLTGFSEVVAKEQTMKSPEYSEEEQRFATFSSSWDDDDVPSARHLAEAGFYFSKRPHATRCFMCGWYFGTWRKDDDPMFIHAALNQFCPFVQGTMSPEDIQKALKQYIDSQYEVNSTYESLESRTTSFEEVADQLYQRDMIHALANAGFYYTGMQDVVACFACGIMLTEVASNRSVMTTHTRLSPNCPFIKMTKGKEYIEDILDVVGETVPQTKATFMVRKFDKSEEKNKDMFLFASNPPRPYLLKMSPDPLFKIPCKSINCLYQLYCCDILSKKIDTKYFQ